MLFFNFKTQTVSHDAVQAKGVRSYIENTPRFSFAGRLLQAAQLWDCLDSLDKSTFFLPTNTALRMLPEHWQNILTHQSYELELRRFLSAYILFGQRTVAHLVDGANGMPNREDRLNTLSGDMFDVAVKDMGAVFKGYGGFCLELGQCDIQVLNGVIHVVERYVLTKTA